MIHLVIVTPATENYTVIPVRYNIIVSQNIVIVVVKKIDALIGVGVNIVI